MRPFILIIIILLTISQLVGLVAFNGFNQRNHPELDWKSISTTNCQIIYHDPLEKEAQQAAGIAQKTFDTLMKTYQITPKKHCIIYISDQDNISNGATVMTQYIFIWVNQNDFTGLFTGNDKWLRKVISHEMSHWFVANSIAGWLTYLIPIYPTFQRNLNEGYAQYFSGEPWGYNRGDRFLKASILSQKPGIPSSEYDGGLLYAKGFAKVRYLSTMYGEDSLIKLLKYRNKAGLYGFGEAFQKVYKKSYGDFDEEWQRYINTYYYGEVYTCKAAMADTTSAGSINDFTKLKTGYYQLANLDWKGDKLLMAARKTNSQKYNDLIIADVVSDSLKSDKLELKKTHSLFKTGRFTKISLSENGKWAAFAVYTRHKYGRLAPRIYSYNVQKHKTYRFGEGNQPEIDTLGGIYYQKLGTGSNDIWYVKPDVAVLPIHFKARLNVHLNDLLKVFSIGVDEQIGNLSLSPGNQKLAFTVFDSRSNFNISILDIPSGQISDVIHLSGMAQSIRWNNDNGILYTVENPLSYNLDIVLYDVTKRTSQNITHPPYNAVPFRYLDGKMYVMADYNQGAKLPGSFTPQLKSVTEQTFAENYYNKWINAKPIYDIPDSTIEVQVSQPKNYASWRNIKWRMGFALPMYKYAAGGFVLSEALGKQILGAYAAVPYDSDKMPWWTLFYENKTLAPTLDLIYTHDQWLSGVGEDKLYYQDIDKVSGKISFPFNLTKPFQTANLALDISYTDVKNANNNPIFVNKGFASFGAMTAYGYSLPWQNSELHPVRSWDADYSLQMASERLGMNMDFNQHAFHAGFAFAPLLHAVSSEIVRTIAVENRSNYEFVNGNQLPQLLPGINQYEILQSGNKPAFKRYYLRGYEDNFLSRKILNVQNELNFKLVDDMKLNLLNDMLSVHYMGLSLWYDHTELHGVLDSSVKTRTYNANGFEIRAETNLLFLPTVLKYGIAYDMDFEKLSDYFLIEIPFLSMIEDNL